MWLGRYWEYLRGILGVLEGYGGAKGILWVLEKKDK